MTIKTLLAAALNVVLVLGLRAQDKPLEAWWLHATFRPTETTYESLPVTEIDPSWVGIAMLSYALLPPEARADLGWMRRGGFDFTVTDFFKRTSVTDRATTGVFEDREGHKGRFLLVLEKPKDGRWKVAFLHKESG